MQNGSCSKLLMDFEMRRTIVTKQMKNALWALMPILVLSSGLSATPVMAEDGTNTTQQRIRGAKAWAENCARCHNLRSPSELSDEEWKTSVTHMRVRAHLPKDMADDIVVFLQSSNKDGEK